MISNRLSPPASESAGVTGDRAVGRKIAIVVFTSLALTCAVMHVKDRPRNRERHDAGREEKVLKESHPLDVHGAGGSFSGERGARRDSESTRDTQLSQVDMWILLGDYDAAQEVLESEIEIAPVSMELRVRLGEVSLMKGDFPSAIEHSDYVTSLDATESGAYYLRAQARAGLEEYREALGDIAKAIQYNEDPEAERHLEECQRDWQIRLGVD